MSDVGDFYYIRRYRDEPGDPLEQREAQRKRELRDREIEEYLNTKIRPRLVSVVTSTTRPTSNLYRGMTIWESDTGKTYVYYGATSTWLPPWEQPWGFVTDTSQLSNGATSGTTSLAVGQTSSFTVPANRRIRIEGNIVESFGDTANDTFQWGLNIDGGSSLRTFSFDIIGVNRYLPPGKIQQFWTSTSGAHTARVTVVRTGGTGTFTPRIYLSVFDDGPAGNAPSA